MNSTPHILLADDNHFTRKALITALEANHYLVDTAENGLIAYEKLVSQPYDLVLLDILMPKMSGLDILAKFSQEGKNKTPLNRILVLSNLQDETVIAKAKSFGIKGYLTKDDTADFVKVTDIVRQAFT